MSWPVRSKRFGLYNGTPAANTFVLLGTVPAGKVWLVKDWSAYSGGGASRTITLMVRIGATSYVLDHSANILAGIPTGNPNRHVVLQAGEELGFQTSTAANIHFQCSGAQLG